MKTKNIILIAFLVLLTGLVSCKKDHDIPTGKVFNEESGGGDSITISVSASPSEGGNVIGGGKYLKGETCVVTASANEGYVFTDWTENGTQVSTSVSYTFTADADRTLVANFSVSTGNYTISAVANPLYGGIVNGSGTYEQGQTCTVTAVANEGYTFINWTENGNQISTDANYTFTVTGNRNLVASFTLSDYSRILLNELNGNDKFIEIYNTGVAPINLEGVYIEKDGIQNWVADNTVKIEAGGYLLLYSEDVQFDMPEYPDALIFHSGLSAKKNIRIQLFTPAGISIDDFNLVNIDANDPTYIPAPASYSRNADGNWYYADATPGASNVEGTVPVLGLESGDAPEPSIFSISVSANPTNGGTVTGGGTYQQGQSCTVTATAANNYTFTNWTENGSVVSAQANYTFTVTSNRTLVANFTYVPPTYTISVFANPSNGGTVTGGGTYQQGQSCTVSATTNSNYTFTNWIENGSVASTQANYTFTVTGNRTLVANFTAQSQAPQGAINGLFTIDSIGNQVYFSKGNLQYNKTTQVWSFMEHQYDMVETHNQNVGENYANQNIISLFGWGTSGYHDSSDPYNVNYQPWSTSSDTINATYNLYGYGPSTNMPSPNLTESSANYDWGICNTIFTGSIATTGWRSLTGGGNGEWNYIFNDRATPSGIRYAMANVNNVNGVILLPDNWSNGTYSLNNTNNSGANFSSNVITVSQWTILEDAGAVFLPAAGYRHGPIAKVFGNYGGYWSSSSISNSGACQAHFYDGYIYPFSDGHTRCDGFPVRLVCPVGN